VDELRSLVAQLAVKDLSAVVNAEVDGSLPSDANVIATPLGGMKSSCMEALVSKLGRWLPMGGGACWMEVLRSLAIEFLAKMRAEVDRVIFFGLVLKKRATRIEIKIKKRKLVYEICIRSEEKNKKNPEIKGEELKAEEKKKHKRREAREQNEGENIY
jgi:hypothetical protein